MSRGFGRMRKALWFVPVVCTIAGVALSLATLAVDRATDFDLVPRWLTGDAGVGAVHPVDDRRPRWSR